MCPRCRKMILPAAARVIRFEKTRRARHFHFMLETRRPKRPAAQKTTAQKVPAAKAAAKTKEKRHKHRKNETIWPKCFS